MWLLVVREVETEDFAGEPKFFHVVFATLASQTVLAEKLKAFKKARRDASSAVFKTTRRVARTLFEMENAHCATAKDTEQNGAKYFTADGAQS